LEQAARKVRAGITLEFEGDRFGNAIEPEFAPDDSFFTVINFSAQDVVVNSEGHKGILPNRWGGGQHFYRRICMI
jgi:hypothetical protein